MLPDVLDECLTRVHSGAITLEECLLEYPQHAEELEPLLEIAHQSSKLLTPPRAKAHFVATSRARILNQLSVKKRDRRDRSRRDRPLRRFWRPAYTVASLLLTVLLLASSASLAWASTDALPGDTLYGMKRGIEEFRLSLTTDTSSGAMLLSQYAERRLEELKEVLAIDRSEDANIALAGYEDMFGRLLGMSASIDPSNRSDALEHVLARIAHHEGVLLEARSNAPDHIKHAIDEAVVSSNHGKQVIELLHQGESPSDIAPGQLKEATDRPGQGGDGPKPKEDKKKTPGPKNKTK